MVTIRERTDSDLDACATVAQRVQSVDAYPHPVVQNLHEWLRAVGSLGAWVAVDNETVVGHVSLHDRASKEVEELAAAVTGLSADGSFGVVSRLMVSPDARGAGVGELLLSHAAAVARQLERVPLLDVGTPFVAARRLYERAGWKRIGDVQVDFGELTFEEAVYVYE